MCCLCLLVGTVLLLVQPPLLYAQFYNATRVHHQPPPEELHRLLAGTHRLSAVTARSAAWRAIAPSVFL